MDRDKILQDIFRVNEPPASNTKRKNIITIISLPSVEGSYSHKFASAGSILGKTISRM